MARRHSRAHLHLSDRAIVLDSVVPDWLVKLVKASRGWLAVREDNKLHWTSATTALGSSCVAWVDDDEEDLLTCLAISDCAVRFSRANNPDLALAKRAIEMLMDALEAVVGNPDQHKSSGHGFANSPARASVFTAAMDTAGYNQINKTDCAILGAVPGRVQAQVETQIRANLRSRYP